MSSDKIVIDTDDRPPIVAYGGRSPVTRKSLKTSKSRSPCNKSIIKDLNNPQCEERWNPRHHISPSLYNE